VDRSHGSTLEIFVISPNRLNKILCQIIIIIIIIIIITIIIEFVCFGDKKEILKRFFMRYDKRMRITVSPGI
jgi:hypothetical protein